MCAMVVRQVSCMRFTVVCIMVVPLCFDQANDYPSYSERKMDDACQETIRWEERLRMLGFTVKSIWEHNYRTLRETDEMQLFS